METRPLCTVCTHLSAGGVADLTPLDAATGCADANNDGSCDDPTQRHLEQEIALRSISKPEPVNLTAIGPVQLPAKNLVSMRMLDC